MNSERLIDLREEKDLLKKEVAKKIGVVESVYSEWKVVNSQYQLKD